VAGWRAGSWRACSQAALLGLLLVLSACGGGPQSGYNGGHASNYNPPGPPEDPWGPYIREAAQRFSVPERWIRAVMRQESGGHEFLHGQLVTSDAGAAGLMQIMPATYEELRERYSLGGDPYDPHDNILAGTGYISELYASYGAPAFLAAYNAGPHRVDDYLAGRGALPNETVNYLASIAPNLGHDRPMSGPLAAYAGTGGPVEVAAAGAVPRSYAPPPRPGCWQDPDAAYDPDAPCRAPPLREASGLVEQGGFTPVTATPVAAVQRLSPRPLPANCWHDPDAAYDPDAPCRTPPAAPAPQTAAPPTPSSALVSASGPNCWHDPDAAYSPHPACQTRPAPSRAVAGAAPARTWGQSGAHGLPIQRAVLRGGWAIQVGAYADPDLARRVAESARTLAPAQLGGATALLGKTAPFGNKVLYRARLAGLNWESALSACSKLTAQRQVCEAVPPGH
jgi:hypothetical protein